MGINDNLYMYVRICRFVAGGETMMSKYVKSFKKNGYLALI